MDIIGKLSENIDLIYYLLFGGVAGMIAGFIMRGKGVGFIGNIIVGIIGAYIGAFLFNKLNINVADGIVGKLIEAVAGASVLLLLLGIFRK